VSPVRYELGFYISEDDILHSYRRDSLKAYVVSPRVRMNLLFPSALYEAHINIATELSG
jgi:hypothetical protein